MPRLRLFAILCFDSQERREAPRLVYRLDTRGAGLYRRQPVTVPPVPCHLRFTRQRHPPRQVTLPPPYPFSRPAAQRVIEVPALHLWFAVLYPRVEHQAVLAVVVVVVGPLVVHPYHPFRDAVRLLRQPAVFIVAVDIVRIFRDAVTLLSTEGAPHYPGMTHRHQLADTVVNGFSADPLQALQSESLITTGDPLSGIAAARPSAPLSDPASNGGINTPFMDLPPIYASPGDRNDDVSAAEMAQRHLAVTPLLRGLGGSLTMSNSDDADDFLEEAGRTLQAAIKGLLDLQQQRNSLSDKHLRPLEDNPLRLNMDYATALDVMFAEGKSPVHLAAPAAVSESLRNVRHHEEANRAAIVESLRVLLDAFSPQNLLRRFVQYRRSHELRQPLDDAGAWQMYSHYYEELASDRQQGFEMLFNEVYAQVYDRVLREKQREPEA